MSWNTMKRIRRVIYGVLALSMISLQTYTQLVGLELQYHDSPDGATPQLNQPIPEGAKTYRLYARFLNDSDCISSFGGNQENPLIIYSSTEFYNSNFGTLGAWGINGGWVNAIDEMKYDSWFTIGVEDDSEEYSGYLHYILTEADRKKVALDRRGGVVNHSAIIINSAAGGGVYNIQSNICKQAGEDRLILLGQFTTTGSVHFGGMQIEYSIVEDDHRRNIYTYVEDWRTVNVEGCNDPTACNYNPSLVPNDQLCCYSGCGCTMEEACNYDPSASCEDGSCLIVPGLYELTFNSTRVFAPEGEQYSWFYNNQPVADASEFELPILGVGSYKCLIGVKEGCQLVLELDLETPDLNWKVENSFVYFLEEVTNMLHIHTLDRGFKRASLHRMDGQVLQVDRRRLEVSGTNKSHISIPITGVSPGEYLLKVTNRREVATKVIVVN